MVHGKEFTLQTKGNSDIKDITSEVRHIIEGSGVSEGVAVVHAVGSTASISTTEFEPALNADFQEHIEKFIPSTMRSRHSETWGDDNGFSHLRATFMGPSITVPVTRGAPVLGTWQQIIVIDHDNRPRSRKVFVQVMGE